jgi:hypothetical protein
MKFLKFEFTDQAEWLTVKDSLYEDGALIPEVTAIHEIGFICLAKDEEGECIDLSTKYAVDMLCEEMERLTSFIVWPTPDGVHIFAGWSEAYTQEFCKVNPDSPYCILPDETTIIE